MCAITAFVDFGGVKPICYSRCFYVYTLVGMRTNLHIYMQHIHGHRSTLISGMASLPTVPWITWGCDGQA